MEHYSFTNKKVHDQIFMINQPNFRKTMHNIFHNIIPMKLLFAVTGICLGLMIKLYKRRVRKIMYFKSILN